MCCTRFVFLSFCSFLISLPRVDHAWPPRQKLRIFIKRLKITHNIKIRTKPPFYKKVQYFTKCGQLVLTNFPPPGKLVVYAYSFSVVTPVIECFTTKNQPRIWEKWNNFPDVTSPEKSGHFRKNDKNNPQHQITHWFTVL